MISFDEWWDTIKSVYAGMDGCASAAANAWDAAKAENQHEIGSFTCENIDLSLKVESQVKEIVALQIEVDYLKDLIKRMTHAFEKFAEILVEYEQKEFPELWQDKEPK